MANISICDDAADLRLLMSLTLHQHGHDVVCYEGGRSTLDGLVTTATVPDLLILDVQMPEMDGWTVLERVRSDPRLDSMRVLMCTVKFSDADLAHAWNLGCDAYLSKPFDLDELISTVQAVLARTATENIAFRRVQRSTFTGILHS